jgi:UDP-N-acetyl-D-glucosamine dehydrogenase
MMLLDRHQKWNINLLLKNISYIEDIEDSEINLTKIHPTADFNELKRCK